MIKVLKIVFIFLYQTLFYCLDRLIVSRERQIVFYVTDKTFGDNLFYFYGYLSDKSLERKLLIQDRALYLSLKEEYENVFYVRSFLGWLVYFRSKCVVVQNGDAKLFFFPLLLNPNTKFILNLWHGIPLKKLNRQVKQYQENRSFYQYQNFSAITVCSDFERLLMCSCFFMDFEKFWITGTPRNDVFFQQNYTSQELKKYENKRVVLYAPTWREYGNTTAFFPFEDFNEAELISFLEVNDTYLFLRGHRLEMDLLKGKYGSLADKTDRIVLAGQEQFPNVPDLLNISSALVTDYSSIYLDYLVLNKPMIFIPYDLERYQSYRGFLFDYDNHTPGDKVFTQKEFLASLYNAINSTDIDVEKRVKEQKLMHRFIDGNAKKRIYDRLCAEIKW